MTDSLQEWLEDMAWEEAVALDVAVEQKAREDQ